MLTLDKEKHEYRWHGKVTPSVTQILKPAVDFSRVPEYILERKRLIGTYVHTAIDLYFKGELDEDAIDPTWGPYFTAFQRFVGQTGFEPEGHETSLYCEEYDFAGTPDAWGRLGKKRVLIDWKSSYSLHPSVELQTAAYDHMLKEQRGVRVRERYALQLRPDGNFKLSEPYTSPRDLVDFLAFLRVYRWKEKHDV